MNAKQSYCRPAPNHPDQNYRALWGSQACSGRDAQGDHYVWRLGQLPGVSGPHRLRRPTEPRRNTPPPGVQIGALSHSLICAIFTNFQVRTLSPSVPVMPEGPKRNAREPLEIRDHSRWWKTRPPLAPDSGAHAPHARASWLVGPPMWVRVGAKPVICHAATLDHCAHPPTVCVPARVRNPMLLKTHSPRLSRRRSVYNYRPRIEKST